LAAQVTAHCDLLLLLRITGLSFYAGGEKQEEVHSHWIKTSARNLYTNTFAFNIIILKNK